VISRLEIVRRDFQRLLQRTILLLVLAACATASEKYAASGFILRVDAAHKELLVSRKEIPGHMEAMVMPLAVRDQQVLHGLLPGMNIDFSLMSDKGQSYAENIVVRPFQSLELDPTQARRLKLMEKITNPKVQTDALAPGQSVPDFNLTD
jgi:Cu/Ag efflux protein CusF